MAVMKVFCGCLSTRSGTFAILFWYMVAYIGAITFCGLSLDKLYINTYYNDLVLDQYNCTGQDDFKDTWWCKFLNNLPADIKTVTIILIIVFALFLLFDLVALFATSRGTYWPLLPWIAVEFIRILVTSLGLIAVLIIWGVNIGDGGDTSIPIAAGIIATVVIAFFSYLWLCVVSYFQILREIDQVTILHTVDSPRHKVTPFIMDPYDTDKESPYDNLSEHTAKESLDGDTVSMRSQAPAAAADPVKSPIGSTIDVKTE